MNPALRAFGATLGGALIGVIVVMIVESCSAVVYPFPDGLDPYDRPAMSEYVATLPAGAFLFVLSGWFLAAIAGAAIARRLAANRQLLPAVIVCGLLMAGGIYTTFLIPHPGWFMVAAIMVFPTGGLIGIAIAAATQETRDRTSVDETAPMV